MITQTFTSVRAEIGADLVPILIVGDRDRRQLEIVRPLRERLLFYNRVDLLRLRLDRDPVAAVVIETRDADGFPVPAAIRAWVEQNPRVPIIVWTAGATAALVEMLDLAAVGADVRLILRGRDDLALALERLLAPPLPTHPGAVPALLRGVVLGAPFSIQPELTLATYHAWPHPSVHAWAEALQITRQALNARLGAARYATASVVLDTFTAAEIAIRCTLGIKLKHIAAAMGRLDERSLRRRLGRVSCRPEQLRDEADFRALIPRIVDAVRVCGPEVQGTCT